MRARLPGHLRAALCITLLHVGIFGGFRVLFWMLFHTTAATGLSGSLTRAYYLGFKFDARLALLLALPLVAVGWTRTLDPTRSEFARRFWVGLYTGMASLWILIYATDLGHYGWLHRRIDATVLDYVGEPAIAAVVVWESYPIIPALLGLLLFLASYGFALRRLALPRSAPSLAPLSCRVRVLLAVGVAGLYGVGVNGGLSSYPLRWSHAYFSPDPFTSALSLNPVLYLWDTWPWRATGGLFDEAAVRESYEDVATYLGVDSPDRDALSFTRHVRPRHGLVERPNIVVVLLEGFGANKAGIFGNPLHATPRFDSLASQGLFFRSFFVASFPTGRSIFSMIAGLPDVNPHHSASRNPLLVHQQTIVNAFKGYEKRYFYTGNLAWANIRGVLSHNIPDLRLFEEPDYSAPHNDGWGISDLALFEEVNAELRKPHGRPFIAFVQTAGNHRPFTIPKEHGNFERVEVSGEALYQADFVSLAELNALRFMDYSLGRFIDLARQEEYFANTIFLIFADHASSGTGVNPLEAIGLSTLHVPLLIYAPALLGPPRVIDDVGSSLDVLPTAAGLAGLPYVNRRLGRDLFHPPTEDRFAVSRLGLVSKDYFLSTVGGEMALFRYRSEDPARNLALDEPAELEALRRRWRGLYETARYLLHHGNAGRPAPGRIHGQDEASAQLPSKLRVAASNAAQRRSRISSASAGLVQRGGARATLSQSARTISPRLQAAELTAAGKAIGRPPTGSLLPGCVHSMARSKPRPRMSATRGCPESRSRAPASR